MCIRDRFSSEALRASGFDGFVTWADFNPGTVADHGGVYIVLRSTDTAPSFEAVSCGGHFKGRNPAVGLDQLRAKWVSGTETVYIGKATSLRTRLRQYVRSVQVEQLAIGVDATFGNSPSRCSSRCAGRRPKNRPRPWSRRCFVRSLPSTVHCHSQTCATEDHTISRG